MRSIGGLPLTHLPLALAVRRNSYNFNCKARSECSKSVRWTDRKSAGVDEGTAD